MQISLEQLLDRYKVDNNQQQRCMCVCRPQQKDFVSLVQWFGDKKVLPSSFDITQYKDGHRLIPYNKDIYGIYIDVKYSLYSEQGHLNTNFDGERYNLGLPVCIVKFNREEYSRTKDEYDKFWEWKKNRNPNRLKMEEDFFFDTKHAMHLVRLLRMGVEALRDEIILVKRPDAKELLSIRNGAWNYQEIIEYAEMMDNEVRNIWYKKTKLPKKPDIKFAAELLMSVQKLIWNKNV